MSDKHNELMLEAKAIIDELFSDTSVSQEETADSLRELIEEMELMIETLR